MKYVWQKLEDEVIDFLISNGVEPKQIILNRPEKIENGNIAFPCFALAKAKKKNPQQIAEELVGKWREVDKSLIDRLESVSGYVNFFVRKEIFYPELLKELSVCQDCYGSLESKKQRIGVEFLSPNTNKPLSIGHARNASLGVSLVNILKFAGFDVVSIVLFNDRGVHICKSMLAYQRWGEGKTPTELGLKPDHMIGNFYVRFGLEAEKNEKLNDEVQLMLKQWEEGDKEIISLWKKMNAWFFEGVNQTLDRVGISFDKKYLESEIYKYGKEIVEKALREGKVSRLSDGAVEVDLSDIKLDKKILLRRDGTTVYMVQDLFLAKKKIDELELDKSIYVVGSEQKYHFDVLFELLERFGIASKEKTYHLAYAMVNAASGKKMSSRLGEVEKWDNILDDLRDLASKEVKDRVPEISENEVQRRAEIIGGAALKFVLLNQDVNKTISFDKNEVVRFEGETGPYLLYTLARINSILDKSDRKNFEHPASDKYGELDNSSVDLLMNELAFFYKKVELAALSYNPSILAKYCYNLSQHFNNFYHHYRVIDAENKQLVASRLQLLWAIRQVLKNGLNLLGIEVLEKM